ncbi:hypothetical protein [Escherichia coli]|nr:hypothetical protein [Escherichia coli]
MGIRLGNETDFMRRKQTALHGRVDLDIGAMITGIGGYNDGNKTR